MDIQGEYHIAAPPAEVWQRLIDPDVLSTCIPGCESMTRVSEDAYGCLVMAKYGPVKAKFKTTLTLSNINAPVSYTLSGRGQGGAAGFGEGVADVMLEETSDGTVLRYTAKFNAGGRIAQVGSRLIVAVTRKLADKFFAAFSSSFDAAADEATA
jgi:carbon monoxide dehydrogenase subunit G